jgi:hypothetical protein
MEKITSEDPIGPLIVGEDEILIGHSLGAGSSGSFSICYAYLGRVMCVHFT